MSRNCTAWEVAHGIANVTTRVAVKLRQWQAIRFAELDAVFRVQTGLAKNEAVRSTPKFQQVAFGQPAG